MTHQKSADHAAEDAVRARSDVVRSPRCTISPIATARCTPRTSISARIAGEVGTPFYCYSSADHRAAFRGLPRRLRRSAGAGLLRDEGQFQSGGADDPGATSAPAWTSSPRANCGARAPPACRRDKIIFSGVGKTRAEMALGARRGHPLLQRRIRAGAGGAVRGRRGARRDARASPSASIRTSTRAPTPRSRPASRKTSSACRSRAPAPSTPARAPCPASPSPASTCISARRSPTCSRSTTPSRCSPISCATLRADGHAIDHVDLGGGLGIPYRFDNDPPPHPERLRRNRRAPHPRPRLQDLSSSRAG